MQAYNIPPWAHFIGPKNTAGAFDIKNPQVLVELYPDAVEPVVNSSNNWELKDFFVLVYGIV